MNAKPFLLAAAFVSTLAHAELTDEQKRVPLEVDSPDKSLAKVVLLAGSVSNKPGQHEYFAGCAMMMNWLKQTPGVWPVMVAEGWPKNEAILDDAKCIVAYMDGGAKLAFLDPARWNKIKALAAKGVGLVALHQTVDIPEANAEEFKSWFGAVWQKDISARGHWDMTFETFPAHPITQGLKPFTAPYDGWLYNLHFADKGVTPLIAGAVPDKSRSTADAKAHMGRNEVVGWAFDRPDGGRSFGYTGCDLHKDWDVESQRRLVVNGIVWSAKLELPKEGAKVDMKPEDITSNMDRKIFSAAKPKAE
jgi:hypothetical protein